MRNTDINLKLSNILNNLPEFFNRVDTELNMAHGVEENYNMLNEYYYDVCSNTIDGLFHIEEQKDFCIEFIEFCMDEFRYFKNIFDYTQEEILNLCPGLTMENYGPIYNKLIELYELDKDIDTVGVGGYNVDFDSMMEPNIDETIGNFEIETKTEIIDSILNKKLNHLKNDYLENLNHIANSKKFNNTCLGFSRYLSGVYKFSLGLTLQIGKLIYGEDESFEMEKYRIEKNETMDSLIIIVDKILQRKLAILKNPDNLLN